MMHTKGPWHAVGDITAPSVGVYDSEGAHVAYCERTPQTDVEQRTANAHLIAAAPEMLEALKLVVLNFQRDQASGNFLGDDDHEAWTACEAAIRKAEGR